MSLIHNRFLSILFVFVIGLSASSTLIGQATQVVKGDFDGLLKESIGRRNLISFNGQLFLGGPIFEEGNRFRRIGLWKVNEETNSMELVKETGGSGLGAAPHDFIIFKNQLFFVAESENKGTVLWKSDGTTEGTVTIEDPRIEGPVRTIVSPLFFVHDETLYFLSNTGNNDGPQALGGTELWRTDGTSEGTRLVKDLDNGQSSNAPRLLTPFNGELFFFNAISGSPQLWKTDGTEEGTQLIKNIEEAPSGFHSAFVLNSKLFFVAQTQTSGGYQFWETDGTEEGTRQVTLSSEEGFELLGPIIESYEGKLLFFARTGEIGASLWSTDGTEEGTAELKVLDPDFTNNRYTTSAMALFQGELHFRKSAEIWKTDGTGSGTVPVFDGENLSYGYMFSTDEELFFLRTERNVEGKIIQRYDGTCTTDVIHFESIEGFLREKMVRAGDKVYFPNALESGNLSDIWSIDLNHDWEASRTWYRDADGDGFGNPEDQVTDCDQPDGYVQDDTDCDDTSAEVTSPATWYLDADGDGYGDANSSVAECQQPQGYVANDEDCDDTASEINPETVWYFDGDGDGFGNANTSMTQCEQPDGYVLNSEDCDDDDATIHEDCVTSIEDGLDPSKIEMQVYPNPSQGLVIVSFLNDQNLPFDFQLISSQAQVLSDKSLKSGNSVELVTSSLPSGIYHVQIMLDGKRYQKRLLIK